MLQDFQQVVLRQDIGFGQVVVALMVAFLCGLLIAQVYRWTYRGTSYAASFVRSMIFLSMITAVVMLVIGNNLARAFGLVGAMSIIRFRTAVKDPQDIVFIFFSLAVGLAAGVGMYQVALVSTMVICLAIVLTTKSNYAVIHKHAYVLQFTYSGSEDTAVYVPLLRQYCSHHQMINVRALGDDQSLELTFLVSLRRKYRHEDLTHALQQLADVQQVNLYYDPDQG